MSRFNELAQLPVPDSVEFINRYVPPQCRFSSTLPPIVRENIDPRFLAVLDWIYYKNCALTLQARDEVFVNKRSVESLKGLLKFFNIPVPDLISEFALRRLIKSLHFIWKNKTTFNGFYAYLKALYGDFFHCEIGVRVTSSQFFSYYNNIRNNAGYYTGSNGEPKMCYIASANNTNPLYFVVIKLYTPISDYDIEYIKSVLSYFIPFFKDTGNNIKVIKAWLFYLQ